MNTARFRTRRFILSGLSGAALLLGAVPPAAAEVKDPGAELYQKHCVSCHGERGRSRQPNIGAEQAASRVIPSLDTGSVLQALTSDEFKDVFDRKKIIEVILNGSEVKGTESTTSMPAFKEKLTAEDVEALLAYLATLPGQRPVRFSSGRTFYLVLIWIFLGGAAAGAYLLSRPDHSGSTLIPIENLERRQLLEMDACSRCGECLDWCPVFAIDPNENISPRDKLTFLRRILQEQHSPVSQLLGVNPVSKGRLEELHRYLLECSTCGQCHVVCPAAIDTVELWESVRRSFVDGGHSLLENQQGLVASTKAYDNPWGQPRSSRAKWAKRAEREKRIIRVPKNILKEKAEVLYYVGCTASYDVNIKEVAINTVKVLDRAGVDFGILGNDERCCGSVLLRMGDYEFERLAGQNIEMFNQLGIKTLVTSCAGCYKTIKQDYPRVGKLNFEVLHMTEYVLRLIRAGRLNLPHPVNLKVTYHDPCHLGRANQLFDAPREVLRSIPGLEFVEIERHGEFSRCCGAGGGLKAGYREVQEEMAATRVRDAERTGSSEFVTACPFCYQALLSGILGIGSELTMRDINELIIMAMGEDVVTGDTEAETASPEQRA